MDYRWKKHLILFVLCWLSFAVWSVPEVVVQGEAISLRTDIAGDKLGALVRPGQRLEVLNKIGRWYYVQTSLKDVGWIFEDVVELDLTTYVAVDVNQFPPQQIYALTTKVITIGGEMQFFQWTASGERIIFLYHTKFGEVVVKGTDATIEEALVSPIFTATLPSLKFLPPDQEMFMGGVSLSADEQKMFVGGSPLNLLFLDENFEIERRERIKEHSDAEWYGGVSFSPRSDRAVVFNLVSEELNGMVDNLTIISVPALEYEILAKTPLDWNKAPVWAPDSLSFLYGGEGKIFVVDEDLKVSEFAHGYEFSFSPDGKTVIYSRDGEIFYQPVGSINASSKTFGNNPDWHPGGNLISYDNFEGLWLEDANSPEKKRLMAKATNPVWSPRGDMLICQTAPDNLVIVYLKEVLDINYVYRLNLGRADGLEEGMLLSLYRPQVGLRDQTVGYNAESWQGFIRIISTQARSSLVKQEKLTRVIGIEEVVVLPSLEKLGRLVRLPSKQETEKNTQLLAGR